MLTAIIDGKSVDRGTVRAWEQRRLTAVLKKLGLKDVGGSYEMRRKALLERKLELGHDQLRRQLASNLKWSERISRLLAKLAKGQRVFSVCEIEVSKGSAEHFARWFDERAKLNDEISMMDACPDHYIISTDGEGRQVVLETTGGSPLATQFSVDYDDVSSIATPPDPSFPFQIAGLARLSDGLAIGGVRHQFRQEGEGFRARLTVEFPKGTMGHMISQHRWHLACEFCNWIEMSSNAPRS